MRQTEETPMSDRVDSLRTMRHIVRQVPLEPESYRESLSGPIALENSIGFVFSKQGTQDVTLPVPDFELRALKSMADVDAAFPCLLTQEQEMPLLGNIFERRLECYRECGGSGLAGSEEDRDLHRRSGWCKHCWVCVARPQNGRLGEQQVATLRHLSSARRSERDRYDVYVRRYVSIRERRRTGERRICCGG